ncbi:MAG: phosphotransferase family protein [Rhodobacter sp.]|nr:phosphotransferase family protein [Rhodobacter sp.]
MTDSAPKDAPTDAPAPLLRWLAAHVPGFRGPARLHPLAGGQSNPTFLIAADSGHLVLRRRPAGPVLPSAHAVDREYRVIRALSGGPVPVPRVHGLCETTDVIGAAFYVMDHVPGRALWDPRLPDLSRSDRQAIFHDMCRTLANLHRLDPAALGLADFGRPGDYLARQVARWTRQYRASETTPIPAMDRLIDWLPAHLPAPGATRLIHGDYRLDNLILHPTEPRLSAVIDWELSTLGDPRADIAHHMLTWHFTPALFRGLQGADLPALGIPDEDTYLDAYARAGGTDPRGDWPFLMALSLFRLAAIMQGIARRALDGSAAAADAHAIGTRAAPVAALGWDVARGGAA